MTEDDQQPRRRGVYWLPNLLTTAALFSGFYAVVAAIDWSFEKAGIAIFVAMIFDGLDGRVARWTHTESAFGKEYDSLSDMVSFGLAPAIVTYQWGVARIAEYGHQWRRLGWLVCFFYAAAAALRLARFNSRTAVQDKNYFEGLPSPSAAAIVAAFVWLASRTETNGLPELLLAFVVTACAGSLMVSRFSFSSFKKVDAGARVKFAYIVLVPIAFVLIAQDPPVALLAVFGIYALSGPAVWAYRKLRAAQSEFAGVLMNEQLRAEYLRSMGISTWRVRAAPNADPPMTLLEPAVTEEPPVPSPGAHAAPAASVEVGSLGWSDLKARVAACQNCGLGATRTQAVFGVGDPAAKWLIVGEAPGAEEDRRGEPFVGRAGQLLNSMLRAIGLAREQVYIANVLKCRPPGNRDPKPDEAQCCLPYLHRQIALLKPSIMLAVGRIAAQNLLQSDETLGKLRQHVHRFGASDLPLVVTYHPAYLLRSPAEKRKAWEDLKFAKMVLERGRSQT